MGLRMKNFNILGVHWKIWLLGRSSQKTDIEGRHCRKRGWYFWGGSWYPDGHYVENFKYLPSSIHHLSAGSQGYLILNFEVAKITSFLSMNIYCLMVYKMYQRRAQVVWAIRMFPLFPPPFCNSFRTAALKNGRYINVILLENF